MSGPSHGAVLVLHDLSAAALNASWRAGLVARDLGVPLRLLHVRGGAPGAADAPEALLQLARDIGGHLGIGVEADLAAGEPLAHAVRAARDASLVVIGSRRGNPLREMVCGTQAERLIRLCRAPVLVVKRPAGASYRRVLAPVELDPDARAVIAAALRLSRRPEVEVLHALDTRDEIGMRACDVPETAVRRYRQRAAQRARSTLLDLIAQAAPAASKALPAIGFGDAVAVVLAREQGLRADLLVLGKRTRGLLADFFLGSVTQRVLARARADVLVLPLDARGRAEGHTSAISSISTQAPMGI
ncbi:MAG TPA: universal stress protein [Ramlibacter sp.]|uniref:universal stress protein n=1 Tax=Ramlibacter sp. TaxID=1917967 RepID=UPI002ED29888